MERFSDTVRGYAYVRVIGVEPAGFIEECTNRGVEFWGTAPEDDYTLLITMRLRDEDKIDAIAQKSSCEAMVIRRRGGRAYATRARRRIIMWCVPAVLMAALIFSSFFIWRIEVVGNETVSELEILDALEECGVRIGSFWPSFTSESVRSRIIVKIPELKWLSVSMFGSRAVVQVRERTPIPDIFDEDEYVTLIAAQPGIIEEISVRRGVSALSVGQTVAAGDVLIDGFVNSPFAGNRFVHADGSVRARTWYELTAFMPLDYKQKVYTGGSFSRYALIIGGRRINFYRNSGILGVMCDNMITEKKLGVSGLFTLPVSLVRETSESYELRDAAYTAEQAKRLLGDVLNGQLLAKIGEDGEVLVSEFTMSIVDGYAVATLRAECRQEIAVRAPLTTTN